MTQTRQLSEKPVTTFNISPSGKLLAYGSSDLSVGVVDASTLRVRMRVLESHAFPATGISWSPAPEAPGQTEVTTEKSKTEEVKAGPIHESSWLASCSADGSLRLIRVPADAATAGALTSLLTGEFFRVFLPHVTCADSALRGPPGSNQFNLLIVVSLTLLILLLSVYVQKKLL